MKLSWVLFLRLKKVGFVDQNQEPMYEKFITKKNTERKT